MDEVMLYLCPGRDLRDVIKIKELVSKYYIEREMKNTLLGNLSPQLPDIICSNCGSVSMIEEHGDITCHDCGFVHLDHLLRDCSEHSFIDYKDHMYSEGHKFESNWVNGKKNNLHKMSKLTDRKQTSISQNHLTTSDYYKDRQRDEVYSLLDNMKDVVSISDEIIDKAKDYYNIYRTQMVRIHKLPLVLASIIWIVMDETR